MMSLYILANLSSPISLPVIASQGLQTITRFYSGNKDIDLTFDFEVLPVNSVQAAANPQNTPTGVLTLSSIIMVFNLAFALNDLKRLA